MGELSPCEKNYLLSSRRLIAVAARTDHEMTFPLLEYYLRCKTVPELRGCVHLAGASPNPRGRKDDLIDALLQVCRTAFVHERLWDFLLTHVTKSEIKVVIARRPPPGLRSTWGSNKASLIATVIRADRPEAAQAQDDTPGSSASSQVPACGVLVPADCSPEVLKARLRRTWIKKARRRLKHSAKKEQRSILTRTALRTILAANPAATVAEVRRQVEEATSLSFASGVKYKFFVHHLLRLTASEKGAPKRRAAPKQQFRMEVSSKKVTADTQNAEKRVAEQDAPLVSGVLVPWSPPE